MQSSFINSKEFEVPDINQLHSLSASLQSLSLAHVYQWQAYQVWLCEVECRNVQTCSIG